MKKKIHSEEDFFKKLDNLVKKRDISYYFLAKETGISPVSFHDWKYGISKPKIDKIIILSNYFSVPPEYFF